MIVVIFRLYWLDYIGYLYKVVENIYILNIDYLDFFVIY